MHYAQEPRREVGMGLPDEALSSGAFAERGASRASRQLCERRAGRSQRDMRYAVHGRAHWASSRCPKSLHSILSNPLGGFSSHCERKFAALNMALPEGYALCHPWPRPLGQLLLSKIAPSDFVEPSTRVSSLCERKLAALNMALPEGFEPSYQP